MGTQHADSPSGLFPGGPPRPTYREPHPVRAAGLLAGLVAGAVWLSLFGLVGAGDVPGYGWWTLAAGGVAWLVALGLARYGDRGVATGVALATAAGWAVAAVVVTLDWVATGDWPLW